VAVSLAALILNRPADPATASAGNAAAQLAGLSAQAERVAAEIGRLSPDRSGRPAQRAVHDAFETAEALKRAVGPEADERLRNALERELEYLDGLGSLLSNPRSPLASELAARGRRARAAFTATPGGTRAAHATRGWKKLLAYAKARRAG
jgi:hypothetical protein